jgi:hypothetical protein
VQGQHRLQRQQLQDLQVQASLQQQGLLVLELGTRPQADVLACLCWMGVGW